MLRERLLDVAVDLICAEGWAAVTMGRIATRVGISRQQVYKELGTRATLGEAVVARETDRVLHGVLQEMRDHDADALTGISAAAEFVLRTAADNPLVKTILLGAHGGDTDLLPLLATRPEPVLERATRTVLTEARTRYPHLGLNDAALEGLAEVVVRLTLSHLFQPTGPVENAVAQIRAVLQAMLDSRNPGNTEL